MEIRDGDWTLVKHDPATGSSTWVSFQDGMRVYRMDTPHDATIAENAEHRALSGDGWKGDYHRIASIPMNVFYDQLAEAHAQGDDRYVSKWLNDADNRAWRTKDGRV